MSTFQKRAQSRRRSELQLRAIAHRARETPSEKLLWAHIRAGQLGVRFRRQVPLAGTYIADFVAPAVKLVVEVDGEWHLRHRKADARRDHKLQRLGYRVLRLDAELVLRQLPIALERIRDAIRAAS